MIYIEYISRERVSIGIHVFILTPPFSYQVLVTVPLRHIEGVGPVADPGDNDCLRQWVRNVRLSSPARSAEKGPQARPGLFQDGVVIRVGLVLAQV